MNLPLLPDFLTSYDSKASLGDMLIQLQRQFPPFDFYARKPDDLSTNDYLMSDKPVPFKYYFEYGQVNRWFLAVIRQAQEFNRKGEFDKAIWAYETLLEQRYPNYKPYDLLITIYRKQKDLENEVRVLKHSIEFFTELREKQKQYALDLAYQYGKEDFALEYIREGKKIHYFGGAFVLYDPVKVLVKWEDRLKKIQSLYLIS